MVIGDWQGTQPQHLKIQSNGPDSIPAAIPAFIPAFIPSPLCCSWSQRPDPDPTPFLVTSKEDLTPCLARPRPDPILSNVKRRLDPLPCTITTRDCTGKQSLHPRFSTAFPNHHPVSIPVSIPAPIPSSKALPIIRL
jgi:hypothetical protein